ncbi:MAG: aldehyde dehydrogenase family protein [Methylacidiphilales bacterium]|nr:aldehyde dehydrogenase family protein [Candidatus Methylacidiphilales bacterium]
MPTLDNQNIDPVAFRLLVDISQSDASLTSHATQILEHAQWASEVFRRYSHSKVHEIVSSVAEVAYQHAAKFAQLAVDETGFGVVDDKTIKNQLTSRELYSHYKNHDYISPRISADGTCVEIPRPAGVIFALIPSTNPIATINFKTIISLLTKNAIVLCPHPLAKQCSAQAADLLIAAAEKAGAPSGIIQVIREPKLPFIQKCMQSNKTNLILATGGPQMVRAAYSSSNPAIGVGPGNAPVFIDSTVNFSEAVKHLVSSKSFDNSVLCTNESVLISLESDYKKLETELGRAGAYVCSDEEVNKLRKLLFSEVGFNVEVIGKHASWIATLAGMRVPANTKVLVCPIHTIGVEEPLSKEKLCPVLAWKRVATREQAYYSARQVLNLSGAGHSAAVHSDDGQVVMDFALHVPVYRVVVNAPCSQGAAGFGTGLSPSFTIGTGFFGRSSVGDNIGPQHLVHWVHVAPHKSNTKSLQEYLDAQIDFPGELIKIPQDGVGIEQKVFQTLATQVTQGLKTKNIDAQLKAEIRKLIQEEMTRAKKR